MAPLLSRQQAAARLGCKCIDTFERNVQPYLPHVKIGRQLFYDEKDLEQ